MHLAAQFIPHARLLLALVAVVLFAYGCAQPARVILYEQRQQMAQRGVRDVQAPVPPARPYARAETPSAAPPLPPRPSPRATVEVSSLPPPPPNRPGAAAPAQAIEQVETAPAAPVRDSGSTPDSAPEPADVAMSPSPPITTARSYERTAERAPESPRENQGGVPADGIHVVTPKQTVYALSRLYKVPVRSLLLLNKLEPPYLLHTGQKVKIPVQRTHVVERGETVYAISRRYDVSLAELVRLNDVGKPFTIVTGQTLLLPDTQRTAVATAAPEETEASGDADEPANEEQVASIAPPPSKRVILPPSTNIPQPKELSVAGFLWPVNGKVISRYGGKGKGLRNDGINIAAPKGAPIRAAQNGVVAYRGNELRGFGNLILIKHDKGYMTAYAHASQILVARGARVKRGDIIGRVGNTGSVDSPQLHFEIRRGRRPIDPLGSLRSDRAELPGTAAPKG